jgi:hypothetical protein
MEDGPLPIFIDRNGDGTPDDTIVVQNDFVTGIRDQGYGLVPDEVFLDQNYPNPFNATTTIRFGLPERSHVTLTVYDLLGQEVARLADGIREAGRSTVVWDAGALPSGLYLCRLDASSTRNPERRFARTIKLVLVK